AARAPAPPERDGRGRSRRPWWCESNPPGGRYRGSSAGRAKKRLPSAPGRSRPCPLPRSGTPSRAPPSRRPSSRSDRAAGRPQARRGASRYGAASSRQWTPLALPPMRPLARCLPDYALPLQMQLESGVAPAEAMVLHQMLVKVLDGETLIALAIEPLDLLGAIGRHVLARRLAKPPINKSGLAVLLVVGRPARERPHVNAKQLRRLFVVQKAFS